MPVAPPDSPRPLSHVRLFKRRWFLATLNLVVVLTLYFLAPIEPGLSSANVAFRTLMTLGAIGLLGFVIVRANRTQASAGLTMFRLILVLEVVMLLFALLYFTLAINGPDQIRGITTKLDALYFTTTTITTTGYGDITPVGQFARAVVTLNLIFNVVFLGAVASLAQKTFAPK